MERQRQDIQLHAKTFNLSVVKEFPLEGIGGSHVQNSKTFRAMVQALKTCDGICFATLDRFFRPDATNIGQFGEAFKPIIALGGNKKLFCEIGELSLTDSNDFMKLILWGSMAGFEKTRIKERMTRGKDILRAVPNAKIDPLLKGVEFVRDHEKANTGTFHYTDYAHTTVKEAFMRVAGVQGRDHNRMSLSSAPNAATAPARKR
jgi:DNA invertase Pin-like site-specific DNA recombinase